MSVTDIRTQQIQEGRRLVKQVGESRPTLRVPKKPAKSKLEGHEAYLKALEVSKASIRIITVAGEEFDGLVKHSDHFTISLEVAEGCANLVFFKHDIARFFALTKPADDAIDIPV